MLPARDRWRILGTTLLSLVLATHLAAATWTVYQGDTFELDDANASIEWGQNYTFNASGFTEYSDTLYLNMTGSVQDRNITLSSNTSAEFNTTLWQYNLSGVSDGKTMIKIQGNATGGTNVTFQFTALPRITYGHYVLSGGQSQTYGYGHDGTVTWHNTDWSADNFTVKYENDTARPSTSLSLSETAVAEGTDVTISCSASDPAGIKSSSLTVTGSDGENTYHPGCGTAFAETDDAGDYTVTFSATDQAGNTNTQSTTLTVSATGSTGPTPPPSAGHSWLLANNSTLFKWEKPLPEAGIQYVAVRTVEPRRTLSLDLRQLRDQPNGTATVQNPYRFYEFTKEQI
ncbi:MAG: hypothetical protein ABEI97_00535, partial [Candidatus Nanohaloarchaea archaeon]